MTGGVRRTATGTLWMICLGCGEPLVVPVDVTVGDANVAHPTGDSGGESPAPFPDDGGPDAPPDHVTDDGDGGAPVADAGRDAGRPRGVYTCVALPDPVLSATVGDAGLIAPSEVVITSTDQVLGCGMPPMGETLDAGPPAPDGSTAMLHSNYQRIDGEPILRAGVRYALSAPTNSNPLDLRVLVAGVYSGDAPCQEAEQLGSIVTLPIVGGPCVNLAPSLDAHFLRLPIEASALFVSSPLQLCDTGCEDL
jgi:hypothetical protein